VDGFRDKVVVVTGAGSGIGRSTALAFAREAASVHVVDVAAERVAQVCAEIAALGQRGHGHVVDCADAGAVHELAQRLEREHGGVDVVQNGVGVLVAASARELSSQDWQRALAINLGSVVNGVTAFLPGMLERGRRAHIVNIASVAGLVAFPYTAPYSASKFAIVGLSQSLACELGGSGVGVTVVCPGMVRSSLVADGMMRLPPPWPRVFDLAYARLADSPDDIARAILRAVRDDEPMVVPAAWLPRLWQLERLAGARFHRGARGVVRALRTVGDWVNGGR
jgi:NAD(P)-dependent dehydrogenase (short-subunit alcohol dehydrogenase family)